MEGKCFFFNFFINNIVIKHKITLFDIKQAIFMRSIVF